LPFAALTPLSVATESHRNDFWCQQNVLVVTKNLAARVFLFFLLFFFPCDKKFFLPARKKKAKKNNLAARKKLFCRYIKKTFFVNRENIFVGEGWNTRGRKYSSKQ